MRAVVALAVLLILNAPAFAQSNAPLEKESYRVITGDALPAHVVWRHFFRLIGRDYGPFEGSPFLKFLTTLAERERQLVLAVSRRSAADEARVWQRQIDLVNAGAPDKIKETNDAIYELDYQQRVRTLIERDALLRALSDASRVALEKFVRELSHGITTTVHDDNLQRFYAPR